MKMLFAHMGSAEWFADAHRVYHKYQRLFLLNKYDCKFKNRSGRSNFPILNLWIKNDGMFSSVV